MLALSEHLEKQAFWPYLISGAIALGAPVAQYYAQTKPALDNVDKAVQEHMYRSIDKAEEAKRYAGSIDDLSKSRFNYGLGGAGVGGLIGNLLSKKYDLNENLSTAIGSGLGAYAGYNFGPEVFKSQT